MRIIRLKAVLEMTGLGRSTLYKKVEEGTFPASVALSERAVGWVEEEIQNWIKARISDRNRS